jgi:indole-3-acetate monooxygenase
LQEFPNVTDNTDKCLTPLQQARRLAPLIRENADEIDRTRQLPRPLFEALADAGLFHLAVPRGIGGGEIDFPDYIEMIEEIGKADASTGWAVNQGTIFGTYAGRMPQDVARSIWMDKPRSVVSNTPAPSARAVVVPGGYRVTGRQGFSTGCRHATWIAAHTQVVENGEVRLKDGKVQGVYMFVPVEQVEILDTWHTRGMRGTGTHTFVVNDVFVPAERAVLSANPPPLVDGALYRIPRTLTFGAGDAAVALGVARSCMNEFLELAGVKAPRTVPRLLRDQSMIQVAVGQAEGAIRAGRALLMQVVNDVWREATAGAVSLEVRVALRLAGTHAIRLAAQAVESIYNMCGATAAFEGNLIQRHFQDIHVITQHVQGHLTNYETVGQHWLGLPIDESRI